MLKNLRIISITIRTGQWAKNLLLIFAPLAAGLELSLGNLRNAFLGFLAFSLISSLGYIFNDINDKKIDADHPIKRNRPLAASQISLIQVLILALILAFLVICLTFVLPDRFNLVLIIYLLNSCLYTMWGKHLPLFEIFQVAAGFILRLIAGALMFDLDISKWFLIVGGFGALMIVAAKRLQELPLKQQGTGRKVLESYSEQYLRSIIIVSVTISISSYYFWAFDQIANHIWFQVSVIPFTLIFFKFLHISEKAIAEFPERVLFEEKTFLALGLINTLILMKAIYG
jgi:decaprenyl-phosphate phosphoribosyltransferase